MKQSAFVNDEYVRFILSIFNRDSPLFLGLLATRGRFGVTETDWLLTQQQANSISAIPLPSEITSAEDDCF